MKKLYKTISYMFIISLLTLVSCSSYQKRGTIVSVNSLKKIVINESTRDSIISMLGHPSTTSVFDNEKSIIYISEGVKDLPVHLPVIKDRAIYTFSFNSNDILEKITTKTLKDGKILSFDSQTTPAVGRKISFWQQMLGNFGRFGS